MTDGNLQAAHDKLQRDFDKLKADRDRLAGLLDESVIDAAVAAAVTKHGGRRAWIEPHVRERVRAVDTADGARRVAIVNGPYDNVSDFVLALKADPEYADAFRSDDQGKRGDDSGKIVISAAAASDPLKYRQLKAQAEAQGKELVMAGESNARFASSE